MNMCYLLRPGSNAVVKAALVVLALFMMLILAACSESKDQGKNQTPPAAAAPADNQTTPPGKQTAPGDNQTPPANQTTAEKQKAIDYSQPQKDINISFADFAVASRPDPVNPDNPKTVEVTFEQKGISKDTESYTFFGPVAEAKDFPATGCDTMQIALYTGGANCCNGYYLLTACPETARAAFLPPGGSLAPKPDEGFKGYKADDLGFMYYEPAGQVGPDKLSLSGAESPRLTRFIVFDNGLWRADRQGEFPAYYGKLVAEAKRADIAPLPKAIEVGYYSYMAGHAPTQVAEAVMSIMPAKHADLAPIIVADIEKSASKFREIENLRLP